MSSNAVVVVIGILVTTGGQGAKTWQTDGGSVTIADTADHHDEDLVELLETKVQGCGLEVYELQGNRPACVVGVELGPVEWGVGQSATRCNVAGLGTEAFSVDVALKAAGFDFDPDQVRVRAVCIPG